MNIIRMHVENHPYVAEVIHSHGNNLPIVICYTEEQLDDFKSFLATKSGVVGVDRTFSLGKCFVTTTVYKSHKVNRKGTGEPPIFMGPLMLHWDGKQKNYFRFFSHIRGVLGCELPNIEILMGTDDEKAMTNAIDMALPGVKRKLCTKHIRDNIIRQTTDKIPKTTKERKEIVDLIFNAEGVATADTSSVFDERNEVLKETLKTRNHHDFLAYYERYVENKLSQHVVSGEDELWTNNNTESINNRLKLKVNWEPKKTDVLVEHLHEVVRCQMTDMRRAMYGMGNFSLNGKFQRFKIPHPVWLSKTGDEKQETFLKFLKSGKQNKTEIVSSDGQFTVKKDPKLAKKPNQRTRCRPHRTPRK